MDGEDKRLFVVVGPCSIHDEHEAYEYARRLKKLSDQYSDKLYFAMRVYLEKPRTRTGWGGLMEDPSLVGQSNFDEGALVGRRVLFNISEIGLPIATEILDPVTPQYISDLISYGAIGARTTENPQHRKMVSGLSFPVGMKNGTGGSVAIAIDGMATAREPHTFRGINLDGQLSALTTSGNRYTQLILRGSTQGINYDVDSVQDAKLELEKNGLPVSIMIDCSHGNSGKDHTKQRVALAYALEHIGKDYPVSAVMLESNLEEGKQAIAAPEELKKGQSVTDGCIGFKETEELLEETYISL